MSTHRGIVHRILVAGIVLLALLTHVPDAVAAPPDCPAGQVWQEPPGMCVPQSQVPASPQAAGKDQPVDLWSLDAGNDPAPDAATVQGFVARDAIVSLSLWHFACDAGTDPREDTPDRIAACTGANKPAAEYELYSGATAIDTVSLQTTDGAMGQSTWSSSAEVPIDAGNLQFLVRPQEGWESTWVTCRIIDASGKKELRTPGLNGTAFAIFGEPGDAITCAWFLVATAPQQEVPPSETATESAAAPSTLNVTFLNCPETVTQVSVQSDLEAACTQETQERPLLITIDGEINPGSAIGTATWSFSQTATVDIGLAHDSIPICQLQWPATTGAEALARDTFDTVGGSLTVTVGHPSTTVTCEWFVFQT